MKVGLSFSRHPDVCMANEGTWKCQGGVKGQNRAQRMVAQSKSEWIVNTQSG